MKIAKAFVPMVLFGLGLVVGTKLDASSPAARSEVQTLLKLALAEDFTPNREVAVDLVQIPPNTTLDRHWHPGEEFHYYLEGDVEIRIDGEPSVTGTAGGVAHIPYKKWHSATAGENGAKVLVFRVHTKGEPWRYVDADNAPVK